MLCYNNMKTWKKKWKPELNLRYGTLISPNNIYAEIYGDTRI